MAFVGGYLLFEAARAALRLFDLAPTVRLGLALVFAGLALVLGSLIAERVVDHRAEGDLSDRALGADEAP